MTAVGKRMHVDPVKATEQFKADLAAMKVGQKDGSAQAQRQLDKNFGVASFKFTRWSAELGEAQTLDDALIPTYWAAQAEKIMGHDKAAPKGRGDIIEIRKADSGLYAELLVVEVGIGFIKTVLVRSAEPDPVEAPEGSPLKPKWNVGTKMWDVVRNADNQVMRAGFQTKAAAVAWISDHMAKVSV